MIGGIYVDVICNIIIVVGIILLIVFLPIAMKMDEKDKIKRKYKKLNMDSDFVYAEEFEKVYEELSGSKFRELEEINIKVKKCNNTLAYTFLTMFAFIILSTVFCTEVLATIVMIYVAVFGALILGTFLTRKLEKLKKEYSLEYKRCIITKIVKLVNETFVFKDISENQEFIQKTYEALSFSEEAYDVFQADDYIFGDIDGRFCRIADISLYIITGDFGEKSLLSSCLFSIINLKNNVSSEVEIKKMKTTLMQDVYAKIYDLEEITKEICIYSDDNILANKLALSGITQILQDYFERFGIEVEIILKDSNLYMKFLTDMMFEPRVIGEALNKEWIYFYYCTLNVIIELTQKINQTIDKIGL